MKSIPPTCASSSSRARVAWTHDGRDAGAGGRRRRKRVLLATAAATDRVGRLFGRDEPLGPAVVTLAPGIDGVNITPSSSLIEYGVKVLRSEMVSRALFENRAVRGLLGAIRGSTPTRCSARPGGTRPRCSDGRPATIWSSSTGPRADTPR